MFGYIISLLSIIFGVLVITYFYFTGGKSALNGAGWILSIVGAPTTLLTWFIFKLGLAKNIFIDLLWILLFYLLQYQLIAIIICKLSKFSITLPKIIIFCLILLIVIVSSGLLIYRNIMGPVGH